MKLENFTQVSSLYNLRSDVLHHLGVVSASGPELTRHFNVHIHGSAQAPEVSQIAAQALQGYYQAQLADIDQKLATLGVQLDQTPAPDPLASLRPEVLLSAALPEATHPLKNAVQELVTYAVKQGGLVTQVRLDDVIARGDDGIERMIGNWLIEVKRVG